MVCGLLAVGDILVHLCLGLSRYLLVCFGLRVWFMFDQLGFRLMVLNDGLFDCCDLLTLAWVYWRNLRLLFFGLLLMLGFISCGYVYLSCLLCWLLDLNYVVGCC